MEITRYEKLSGPLYNSNTTQQRKVSFIAHPPADDLKFFVENYWLTEWELQDQPSFWVEHLPDPSIHLIVENELSGVFGPGRGRFSRLVEGQGWALCIKFRPGAFHLFMPIARVKDKLLDLSDVFGDAGHALMSTVRSAPTERERIEIAEEFLYSRHPEQDDSAVLIHQIIEFIVTNREVTRSSDLEAKFSTTQRTLQRLFNRYVGVSPSWVIRRYRIHEAINRLDRGEIVDWPSLAVNLGYYDQAHFIKDIKNIIGVTPGAYVRRISQGESV